MAGFDFVSAADFQRMVDVGHFIEFREKLHGNMYGTAYSELKRIEDSGKIPLIEVDV